MAGRCRIVPVGQHRRTRHDAARLRHGHGIGAAGRHPTRRCRRLDGRRRVGRAGQRRIRGAGNRRAGGRIAAGAGAHLGRAAGRGRGRCGVQRSRPVARRRRRLRRRTLRRVRVHVGDRQRGMDNRARSPGRHLRGEDRGGAGPRRPAPRWTGVEHRARAVHADPDGRRRRRGSGRGLPGRDRRRVRGGGRAPAHRLPGRRLRGHRLRLHGRDARGRHGSGPDRGHVVRQRVQPMLRGRHRSGGLGAARRSGGRRDADREAGRRRSARHRRRAPLHGQRLERRAGPRLGGVQRRTRPPRCTGQRRLRHGRGDFRRVGRPIGRSVRGHGRAGRTAAGLPAGRAEERPAAQHARVVRLSPGPAGGIGLVLLDGAGGRPVPVRGLARRRPGRTAVRPRGRFHRQLADHAGPQGVRRRRRGRHGPARDDLPCARGQLPARHGA